MLGFNPLSTTPISDLGGLVSAIGTAAGTSSATAVATGLKFSTGTIAGAAVVGGAGRAGYQGVGSASGAALAIASTTIESGTGASTGAAAVAATGFAGYLSVGAAAGQATVKGQGGTRPASFDWWQTVISQYANSSVILQLIDNFDQCVDQTANMQAFYDLIWNVDTAKGYGLDVWGRIVGVSRVLTIEVGSYFGMVGPTGASGDPYNVSAFYAGGTLTTNFALTDAAFRTLIFAKALSNISDGSIKSINQILINLFGSEGNAYVTDGNDMTMTYTFEFELSPVDAAIVGQSGVLPKPLGVLAAIVQH